MLDYLRTLFESETLSPHGICLLWRPELIWTHAISDLLIGSAYYSIPVALGYFVAKRRDMVYSWVFWSFAIFILACGTTHFLSVWTLWVPDYGSEALVKLLTAAASVATAIALWPLLPRALALPSPEELRRANADLQLRIEERDAALRALRAETERRLEAEAKLRQSQKMEAIGQLTGGIAHDFNNLLTVVVANLDRIERRLSPDDEVSAKAVQGARRGADRAADLNRRLLAFARRQPLQPTVLDGNDLVRGIAEMLGRTLGENVAIQVELAPDLWPIRADEVELQNAIVNLAVNARDAMPDGGRLTISTGNETVPETTGDLPAGDYAVIAVADTGTGMPPDVLQRALEPFFTTKPVGKGSGLGLSQVYGFVKQSGGHLDLQSSAGQGTIVRLKLPRATRSEAADAS